LPSLSNHATSSPVIDRNWLILQLTDSAFPTGAFAHSGGLEAVWQSGETPGAAGLAAFLSASLQQAAGTTAAIVAMTARSPQRFAELDDFTDAMLLNAVANKASRSQGQALLAASTRVFGSLTPGLSAAPPRIRGGAALCTGVESLESLARSARSRPCHLAPVFGMVHAELGVDPQTAVSNFLFVTLRGLVSAAVRLGIVGPLEGQTLQFEIARGSDGWVDTALSIEDVSAIASTAPLLDYYQSMQELLYSRLFVS
jgi:urease accessory protein